MSLLRVALLQITPARDINTNMQKGIEVCREAKKKGADIALFPEMFSCGYDIYDRPFEGWERDAISKDSEFVKIADYLPGIAQELAYATEKNFTGKVVYVFTDAYLRAGTLKKLEKARGILLSQGYDLKIWDGFRPVYAQAKLYEAWPDPNYVSHPVTGYRAHCRGNAVDLTLIDLATGQELEMRTGFDDFSAKADRDYSDCTETQRRNAKLLESAMTSAGFTPYQSEWWHYTDPISYLVDEYFDPAVVSLWKANCDEYITLRTEPDSKADSRGIIRKDEVFTLMGWTEAFAYVSFQGKTGFVLSSYICPVEDWGLSIVQPANPYSYEQMLADIETLADTYPDAVTLGSIGKSEAGRDIPVILLGDPEAETHILIQSTVHALEHMCTWLIMSITEYHAARGGIDGVCFHIIPMMNPDGDILAQTGIMTEEQKEIYESDKARYYTQDEPEDYAALWKANGLGVDINRNFDAGWQQTSSRPVPSVMLYKGTEPFSSAEAAALRDYTLSREFAVTVSYHAMGCVIYWQYGSKEPVNSLSESLGQAVGTVTGYSLHGSDGRGGPHGLGHRRSGDPFPDHRNRLRRYALGRSGDVRNSGPESGGSACPGKMGAGIIIPFSIQKTSGWISHPDKTIEKPVIANQCAHWCGNPFSKMFG